MGDAFIPGDSMTEARKSLRRLGIAGGVIALLAAGALMMLAHRPPAARELPARRDTVARTNLRVGERLAALAPARATTPASLAVWPAASLFDALPGGDHALLDAGPFSLGVLRGQRGNRLGGFKLNPTGTLAVWKDRFVEAERIEKGLATELVSAGPPKQPEGSGAASPAFSEYLDALETELDSGPVRSPLEHFPWVIARAHARGDAGRARDLLRLFSEASIAAYVAADDAAREAGVLEPLRVLLMDLLDAGLLADGDLAGVAAALDAAVLSDDEVKARDDAAVLAWAEARKQPDPAAPMLGTLLAPLYARNVDSLAAAVMANDGMVRATIQLQLVEMLGGGRDRGSPDHSPPMFYDVHPRYKELMPWSRTRADGCNLPTWAAQFQVAAMRHRLREGRWPASAAEIAPDMLPADFVERTGSRWCVLELKDFQYPSLTTPPDPPTRLALNFMHDEGRHAKSAEELRAWAAKRNRPEVPPPFVLVAEGPLFISLEPQGPAVDRHDNGYVIPWEKPTPADEALIRAAVAKSGGPEWAICRYFLRADVGRWGKAMAVLGKGGS